MEEVPWLVGQKHILGFLGIHIHIVVLRPSTKLVDRRLHYSTVSKKNYTLFIFAITFLFVNQFS